MRVLCIEMKQCECPLTLSVKSPLSNLRMFGKQMILCDTQTCRVRFRAINFVKLFLITGDLKSGLVGAGGVAMLKIGSRR